MKPRQISDELSKFFKNLPCKPEGKDFHMARKQNHDKRKHLIYLDEVSKMPEQIEGTYELKRSLEKFSS